MTTCKSTAQRLADRALLRSKVRSNPSVKIEPLSPSLAATGSRSAPVSPTCAQSTPIQQPITAPLSPQKRKSGDDDPSPRSIKHHVSEPDTTTAPVVKMDPFVINKKKMMNQRKKNERKEQAARKQAEIDAAELKKRQEQEQRALEEATQAYFAAVIQHQQRAEALARQTSRDSLTETDVQMLQEPCRQTLPTPTVEFRDNTPYDVVMQPEESSAMFPAFQHQQQEEEQLPAPFPMMVLPVWQPMQSHEEEESPVLLHSGLSDMSMLTPELGAMPNPDPDQAPSTFSLLDEDPLPADSPPDAGEMLSANMQELQRLRIEEHKLRLQNADQQEQILAWRATFKEMVNQKPKPPKPHKQQEGKAVTTTHKKLKPNPPPAAGTGDTPKKDRKPRDCNRDKDIIKLEREWKQAVKDKFNLTRGRPSRELAPLIAKFKKQWLEERRIDPDIFKKPKKKANTSPMATNPKPNSKTKTRPTSESTSQNTMPMPPGGLTIHTPLRTYKTTLKL